MRSRRTSSRAWLLNLSTERGIVPHSRVSLWVAGNTDRAKRRRRVSSASTKRHPFPQAESPSMRSLTIVTALALCFAATEAKAAPILTAPASVTYELGIYDLTVTPDGPTVLNVAPGALFTIEGE